MKIVTQESILNRKEDITVKELKKIGCLQHLSDEGFHEAVEAIKKFTEIAYAVFSAKHNAIPVIKMNRLKTKAA